MKKILSMVLAALLVSLALIGCGGKGSDANNNANGKADAGASNTGVKAKIVRVATQPSVPSAKILLVKVNGYLTDELKDLGVSVKWDSFNAGPPMNEAFAAGEEDIGIAGDVPVLISKGSGQKTVIFGKASSGEKTVALVVKPNSPITDLAQLKGKKVAYVKGSYGHHLLWRLLKKGGLTYNDIKQINLPNADIGNAVGSNQADAGIIWEPGLTGSIRNGTVKVLADATGIKSNSLFFFATEAFAKDNPKILEAFLRAVEKADDFIARNPQKSAEVLQGEINLPVESLAGLFERFSYSTNISDADILELKDIEEFNRLEKLTEIPVDVDKFVDKTFLNAAGITK